MLTRAEMVAAVENGDPYCRCGYRKSLHDNGEHPAIDPHTKQCNNHRYERSIALNEAVLLHAEHHTPSLFEGEDAA